METNWAEGDEAAIEAHRLAALADCDILDTEAEPEYDHIAEFAADFCEAPIAAVSFVAGHRVWFKASVGLDVREVPREIAFCDLAVRCGEATVIEDARLDPRLRDTPLVCGPAGLRFYAGAPLILPSGAIIGTVCVFDRVARPRPDERQLELLRHLARLVVDRLGIRRGERIRRMAQELANTTSDAIVCTDGAGTITHWNPAAERIFGHSAEEAIGHRLDLIVPDRFAAFHRHGFHRLMQDDTRPHFGRTAELFGRHRDGHEVPIELSIAAWRSPGEIGVGAIIRDISERRRNEERIRWLAHYDALTGLPNRATLAQALTNACAPEEPGTSRHRRFTLALFDLDGFKDVNDTLGHATGDTLLGLVARRLTETLGEAGTVYRLGGDEFALLMPDIGVETVAQRRLSALQVAVALPYEIDRTTIAVEGSVGFALAPDDGLTPAELLSSADLALYRAKHGRLGHPCRYTCDLRSDALARRALDTELRVALAEEAFELHYQPQIDYDRDEAWIGAEALLRWNHPRRGLIGPDAFLGVLEAGPLASPVGSWVLRTACLQAAAWRRARLGLDRIAVNLFAAQLRRPHFVDEVARTLEETGLPPTALEFEITEKIALSLDETPLHTLHALRDMGVSLAFDDFGTGYASLSALKRYPIDRLKIDRSFVRELPDDESDGAIVGSILAIGAAMGLEVVAEGVETPAQRDWLRVRGCTLAQGYLHARPMPAARLTRLLMHDHTAAGLAAGTGHP